MEQSLQALSKRERLDTWTTRIMDCRSSGMSVRNWCQENGLNEKTYYYCHGSIIQARQKILCKRYSTKSRISRLNGYIGA